MSERSFNPPFILDANVFIQAHRLYYAFEICPGFWESIIRNYSNGLYLSIDKVRQELEGNDALWDWVNNQLPNDFFKTTTEASVQQNFATLMQWAQFHAQFAPAAKTEFATVADAWIIAYCMAKGRTIVTQETLHVEAKARIPIPNVCEAFQVPYCGTFDMLRKTNTSFRL